MIASSKLRRPDCWITPTQFHRERKAMSEHRHEAVIAAINHDEPIQRFRENMPEDYRRLLVISENPGAGYSCVLLPDGSKEGFAVSRIMDDVRRAFIELLKDLGGDWAHVVLYDENAL